MPPNDHRGADPPRRGDDESRSSRVAAGAGVLLTSAFVVATATSGGIAPNVRTFQLAYFVGIVGYVLIAWSMLRSPTAVSAWWWFAGIVLIRLCLLNTQVSDDVYRYVWEGRIQNHGFNPYALPPDAEELSALRDEHWPGINHPSYTAIYAPFAQLVFRLVADIDPSPRTMKAALVFFDLAAVALSALWLRSRGLAVQHVSLYALCPLTITAVSVEGHLDSITVAWLAATGIALQRRRPNLAGVALAGAVLTKTVPVVLIPWLFVHRRRSALLCLGIIVAGYLPYADAGLSVFHSLFRFAGGTQLLGPAASLLSLILEHRTALVLCAAAVIAVIAVHLRIKPTFADHGAAVFPAILCLMPVVHYWYVLWLLAFLPIVRRTAPIVFAASMVFYFEAAAQLETTGAWEMPTWVTAAVFAPFLTTWAVELFVSRRSR